MSDIRIFALHANPIRKLNKKKSSELAFLPYIHIYGHENGVAMRGKLAIFDANSPCSVGRRLSLIPVSLPSFLPSSSFLASTRLASSQSLAQQHFDPFYVICAMNPSSVYMVVAVGSY